jgi:DNA invertase Pin-like site-specific DNA recombinase
MTTAHAYVRMSTDDQSLSPAAQRQSIAAWAAKTGATVASEHQDLGISGAAQLDKRPGLVAALSALQKGDVLVVSKRDRLGRDALLLAMVESAVARKGARIVSVAGEGTDGDDPAQVLMRRMIDAFAEYERLIIKSRTKAALSVKKSRGERTGTVPYGWVLGQDGVRLEPVAQEQAVIARARELRADGMSLRWIALALALEGKLSRAGVAFQATQVARMIEQDRAA